MQIPTISIRFFGQRRLEVREVVTVRGFNEKIGYEVNGVRWSC